LTNCIVFGTNGIVYSLFDFKINMAVLGVCMKELALKQLSQISGGSFAHHFKWLGMGVGFGTGSAVGAYFSENFANLLGIMAAPGAAGALTACPWYATVGSVATGMALGMIGGGCVGLIVGAGFDFYYSPSK